MMTSMRDSSIRRFLSSSARTLPWRRATERAIGYVTYHNPPRQRRIRLPAGNAARGHSTENSGQVHRYNPSKMLFTKLWARRIEAMRER